MTDVYTITACIKRDHIRYVLAATWTLEAAEKVIAQFAESNGYPRRDLWITGDGPAMWTVQLSTAPEYIHRNYPRQEADYIEITKTTIIEPAADAR